MKLITFDLIGIRLEDRKNFMFLSRAENFKFSRTFGVKHGHRGAKNQGT